MLLGAKVRQPEHLVLTAPGGMYGLYGTYNLKPRQGYPSFDENSGIYSTQTPSKEEGMRFFAYCSHYLGEDTIFQKLREKLNKPEHAPHLDVQDKGRTHGECLKIIESMSQPATKIPGVKEVAKRTACSQKMIISLAYRNQIYLQGLHSRYAPESKSMKTIVNADIPLSVSRVTETGMFMVNAGKTGQKGLAWYFGYLHLFQRDSPRKPWYIVTRVGREAQNGALLSKFLIQHVMPQLHVLSQKTDFSATKFNNEAEVLAQMQIEGRKVREVPSTSLKILRFAGYIAGDKLKVVLS
ncbi:BgTH12-07061 [Blumeria graminis f. sp. triticale]|uniref:BgTH12-07061 n=1 Tax=Blumeria graminis f. sp. triticale TaxID=1689686 RepID=A0A9W4D8L9_BLUGR|nr:BgTH12-07061 [Blumeria graminis f. sp. triticale]